MNRYEISVSKRNTELDDVYWLYARDIKDAVIQMIRYVEEQTDCGADGYDITAIEQVE